MALTKIQGFAEQGGAVVITSGTSSITTVERSFPGCSITVYNAGTAVLASIFSDSASTPKSNPFTSGADGGYEFWIESGSYDVQFSGAGISTPFKLTITTGGGNGVASVFGRTGAVVAATNDYTWAQIDKTVSSIADITTRSAGALNSGTLDDARLSANVTVGGNVFTGTGSMVRATSPTITSPTLVTPVLGVATGTSLKLSATTAPFIISPTGTTYAAYSGASESGPGVFVHRTVAGEASDNEHGFIDATQFGRANKAYASFDSQMVFTGTNNYDHVSNFQARAVMASSGTLTNYYSFFSAPITTAGTVTNLYGFYAGAGSTVPLSVINRYAFVSETGAGNVGIGTTAPTFLLTVGAPEAAIGSGARMGVFGTANTYAIFRDTTANIEMSIGTDGSGGFLGPQSNHGLVFVTNAATKMTLNAGGQLAIGVSAPATSAILDLQGTTGALLLSRLSTAQRDALTPSNGMVFYNTSTDKVQARAAGAWVDLH